jgi:Phosphotransferase enzyme family
MPSFDAIAMARRLLGHGARQVRPAKGGRNAEVWRIDTADGAFALKRYVRSDVAGRMARETAALRFLERHAVANVARVVAADAESGVILLTWLPGTPVAESTEADILACADFVVLLRNLATSAEARALPEAKEACGSVAAILAQIDVRIDALSALSGGDFRLREFLAAEVEPRRHALTALLQKYPDEFPLGNKTLSASDFGTHNALRDADGRLSFLDFEYFGWDDPVKLVADFLLHPGMDLPVRLRRLFSARMRDVFGDEPGYAQRLAALLPAYQLRWSLIMMNPVLDAAGIRGHEGANFADAVRTQTERAGWFLQTPAIPENEEGERYVR